MDKPTISRSKAEKVARLEDEAFVALGDYFFIAKGRKTGARRGYVDIHVKPKKLEALFESWLSARLKRHDYNLQDAKDVLKMLKDKKYQQAVNQIKPVDLLQSDMRQYVEICENHVRDDMMMVVVASVIFTLFSESTKLSDLRNQMKTFSPLMRKLQKRALERSKQTTNQNGLSNNPFFQDIWARQKDRGVII